MANPVPVCIIGMGLAGSECAWQLLKRQIPVTLVEMRPLKKSEAHHGAKAAELVCSNSLRSNDISNAVGLLKEEMASLDSLIIRAAYKARVPAGSALAVDRESFSDFISERLNNFSNFSKVSDVVRSIKQNGELLEVQLENGENILCQHCVVATGPLTEENLASWIQEQTQSEYLYFYDSIAPIVDRDSINMKIAFRKSRYDKGQRDDGDYINCPMNKEQYQGFVEAIEKAELAEVKDFDKAQFFEGCLPIEEMIRRGRETLLFGPLKPVGISNPHDMENKPHAIVQLRQDNLHDSLYNMVGFQTRMKWGEQKRIFKNIPGLENAEFHRMGSMHRNTYLCSPQLLKEGLELKSLPGLHFAGQITGCEGYVESAATGLWVGLDLSAKISQKKGPCLPATTALGALVRHILKADAQDYQPMNINWGLFEPLDRPAKKAEKKLALVKRAAQDFRQWLYEFE